MWTYFIAIFCVGAVAGHHLDASVPPARSEILHEMMTVMCTKYGHPEEIDHAVEGSIRYSECVKHIFDVRELFDYEHMDEHKYSSSFISSFESICEKKIPFIECHYDMLESLSPCLEPSTSIDAHKDLINKFTEFLCHHHGEHYKDFVKEGGLMCMLEKKEELSKCVSTIPHIFNEKPFTYENLCFHFKKTFECVLDTVKECPKPSTAEFISKIVEILDMTYQCRHADFEFQDAAAVSHETEEDHVCK